MPPPAHEAPHRGRPAQGDGRQRNTEKNADGCGRGRGTRVDLDGGAQTPADSAAALKMQLLPLGREPEVAVDS